MTDEKGALKQALEEEAVTAKDLLARNRLIQNKTLTLADTEYKIAFPENTRKFTIQARTSVELRIAFETGAVADTTLGKDYATVKAGDVYFEDFLDLKGTLIIYIACGTAGTVIEIIKWWR